MRVNEDSKSTAGTGSLFTDIRAFALRYARQLTCVVQGFYLSEHITRPLSNTSAPLQDFVRSALCVQPRYALQVTESCSGKLEIRITEVVPV
jgi:hypothetical protein